MSNELVVKIAPETQAQIKEALSLTLPAKAIATQDEYVAVGNFVKEVKARQKRLDAELKTVTDPLNTALKNVRALFKPALDFLNGQEKMGKDAISDYDFRAEQARAKLEAELRAKQESERKKLEEQAAALRAKGQEAKAAAKEAKAETIAETPIIVATSTPKLEGVSKKVAWKYRIVDANKIPREYLMPDEKKIGAVVRATAGTLKIDGIEAYPETILSSRAAKVDDDAGEIYGGN